MDNSMLDALKGNFSRVAAVPASPTLAEERDASADSLRDAYAGQKNDSRAYTAAAKPFPHEYVPTRDNRDELIPTAVKMVKAKLENVLDRGGMSVDFDSLKIEASHEDRSNEDDQVIDKAMIGVKAQVLDGGENSTPLGFVVMYDSASEPEFSLSDEFLQVNSEEWTKASPSNITASVLDSQGGNTKMSERPLVYFNGDSGVMGYEIVDGIADMPRTIKALKASGFEVTSRYFGPEHGLWTPGKNAYEIGAYDSKPITAALDVIRKVNAKMENEGTEWDERADEKNPNEFKKTEFPDRSLEKNPPKGVKELDFADRSLEKLSEPSADVQMKLAESKAGNAAKDRLARRERLKSMLKKAKATKKAEKPTMAEIATGLKSIADQLDKI